MGVGDTWGTREQLLHPRDSKGRFRSTWKMASGVVDKILSALSSFNPKTFTSEDEARGYVGGIAKSDRYLTNRSTSVANFMRGFTKVNDDLRAGKETPASKEMDKAMRPLPDDLILTQVVGPETFGLDVNTLPQVEELTGKLVRDKGFNPMNVGAPVPHGPGQVTLSIATPAGTKAIAPSTGQPTRELVLDRNLPLRVTKVDPDGQGGFYVYAVATNASDGETPVDIRNAVPKPGEEVGGTEQVQAQVGQDAGTGTAQAGFGRKQGRPAGPGPEERTDGHVGTVGQGDTGTGTGTTPEVTAEEVLLPEKPESGTDPRNTFQKAFEASDVKVPSVGTRRKEFNDAYLGVASGKKTPQEAVADLDNRIAMHKRTIATDAEDGTDSGPLPEDVKRMEALSDLIKEHFNFTGRKPLKKTTPEKKATKAVAKKTAPEGPKKTVAQADAEILKAERGRKATIRKELREERAKRGEKTVTTAVERERIEAEKDVQRNEIAAERAKKDAAAAKVMNEWLADANVQESDLTDVEKTGLRVISGSVSEGRISRREAKRRLGESRFDNLRKVGASIQLKTDVKLKTAKKAVRKVTPAAGDTDRAQRLRDAATEEEANQVLDGMTVAELRKLADEMGITVTGRKDQVRKDLVYWGNTREKDRKAVSRTDEERTAQKVTPEKETETKVEEKKPEDLVRKAYDELSRRPGDWVAIADLREKLSGMSREDQDKVLTKLATTPGVHVIPWDNRKALTDRDRSASVRIGGDDAHAIRFDQETSGKKPAEKGLLFMTVPELRQKAKDSDIRIPSGLRLKKDIVDYLADALTAKERGEEPGRIDLDKMTLAELRAEAQRRNKTIPTGMRKKVDIVSFLRGKPTDSAAEIMERERTKQAEADERRQMKASRMQLADERRRQREAEVQARREQREALRKEKAAQAEQEKIRKQQEREAERARKVRETAQRKAEQRAKRDQERREKKAANSVDYDTLKDWKVSEIRELARQLDIRIPDQLRSIEEIRQYVVKARNAKEAARQSQASLPNLVAEANSLGIDIPFQVRNRGAEAAAAYLVESKQMVADLGIDPAKWKPGAMYNQGAVALSPNQPLQVGPDATWKTYNGYVPKRGVLVHHKGNEYVVEMTPFQMKGPYHMARVISEIQAWHDTMPNRSEVQNRYSWLLGRNLDDEYWAEQYKTTDFKSLATAGSKAVTVWNQLEFKNMPADINNSLDHEFGHNMDNLVGRLSQQPRWEEAGRRDWEGNHTIAFRPNYWRGHPTIIEVDVDRAWQHGVSEYGKSSAREDFAESVSQYLGNTWLGTNIATGERLYFWDLFPERNRILDRLFPEVARQHEELRKRLAEQKGRQGP